MIEFWLSFSNGAERLRLPVNPEKFTISSPFGFSDFNVPQLGEMTVIGDPSLKEFSFDSFFPYEYNSSFCEYEDLPQPQDAIALIEKWRLSRRPCRLTITGTPINYAVTVRDFSYGEQAGTPGEYFYSITLKEYKFITFRTIDTTRPAITSSSSKRESSRQPTTSYVVKSGDTLWAIAQRFLGDGARWRDVYNANKAVVGPNPDLIYPGQKLVIQT